MRIPDWLKKYSNKDFISILKKLPSPVFIKLERQDDSDPPGLPYFVDAFDELLETLERIPTQNEFADHYICKARTFLEGRNLNIDGFRNRALRNYPSFLRELQLYTLLKDKFAHSTIESSPVLDMEGVDLLVTNEDGLQFGICSFTNTEKACRFNERKDNGLRKYVSYPLLALAIDRNNCTKINGFWCYNDSHVRELENLIREKVLRRNSVVS